MRARGGGEVVDVDPEKMVRHQSLEPFEPERRELGEDLALVGNA